MSYLSNDFNSANPGDFPWPNGVSNPDPLSPSPVHYIMDRTRTATLASTVAENDYILPDDTQQQPHIVQFKLPLNLVYLAQWFPTFG